MSVESKEAKIYELSYLLASSLKEEEVPAKVGNLKEAISNLGGVFIFEEYPRPIELSYVMERMIANKKNKFSQGYFGWFKFEMDAESVGKLKNLLALDESIIRFLIIRTVRENTLAPRQRLSQTPRTEFIKKRSEIMGTETKKEEMTKETVEEIDKKIEELVA